MKKSVLFSSGYKVLLILFTILCLQAISLPAFGAQSPIAKLTKFSGTVLIKNNGSWGTKPVVDLPLYSGDKLVTKIGDATITFNDGAVMEIRPNSNLLVQESEDQSAVDRTVKTVKRRLRLLLGKMFFKTGRRSRTKTNLETTTMVCGLRGTSGVISIDESGQTYLQFTEGGGDTVGNFISGEATDVPSEVAGLNPAQRAAFVAEAAAQQAANAAERAATGEISDAEAALAQAEAAEAAAQESRTAAEQMLTNPDPEIQSEAQAAISMADEAIEAAKEAQEQAREAGATGAVGSGSVDGITEKSLQDEGGIDELSEPKSLFDVDIDIIKVDGGLEDEDERITVMAPNLVLSSAPGEIDNTSAFEFQVTGSTSYTLKYRLDGGEDLIDTDNTLDLGLATDGTDDGTHTIEVIATDTVGNESIVTYTWIYDTTFPLISVDTQPDALIDSTDVSFSASCDTNNEPGTVTLSYTLVYKDGDTITTIESGNGDSASITTTGLEDGDYTFTWTATDLAGNSSSEDIEWTLDTTPPENLTVTETRSSDTIEFTLSSDDTSAVTYSWSIVDDVSGATIESGTGSSAIISTASLTEDSYTFNWTATDELNKSTTGVVSISFEAYSTVAGNVYGTGSIIEGTAAGQITAEEEWRDRYVSVDMEGTWSGPHTGTLSLVSGGYSTGSTEEGIWLSETTGSISLTDGSATGTSDYTLLTWSSLVTGSGSFIGTFNSDNTWTGTEETTGLVSEPLSFVGDFYGDIIRGVDLEEGEYNYTGTEYSYYSYEYATDGSYGYVRFYSDGSGTLPNYYIEYYQDGTYYKYDYITSTTSEGNWVDEGVNLADIKNPPAEYGTNYTTYYYNQYEGVEANYCGYIEGLIGGTESIWADGSAPFTELGMVNICGDASIWSAYTYSNLIDTYEHKTIDGGAYYSFIGGIKKDNDLQGLWIGIGVDPTGVAGYVRGSDFSGEVFENDMQKMTGNLTWEPRETIENVTADNLVDSSINHPYSGYMTIGGQIGNNGKMTYGGGYYYGESEFGTASIVDYENYVAQPWGIYKGWTVGEFENPNNETTWTSHMGGDGYFGAYFYEDASGQPTGGSSSDRGFFVGETSSSWANGILSADFTGDFMTYTKMGTMEGDVLGTYNDSTGTFELVSLGTWEKTQDLAFFSEYYMSIYHATKYHYGEYTYSGGGYYYYQYYDDNHSGYYYNYTDSASQNYTYVYYYDEYYYDNPYKETYVYENGVQVSRTTESWDPETESLADLANPMPPAGETATELYNYTQIYSRYTGDMDGVMGGTSSLWSGSDIPVTFLGMYHHEDSSIWSETYMYSRNLISNSNYYTTYDGGTYYGFLGGISREIGLNEDGLEGMFAAIYIDPGSNSGYLLGDMSGTGYPESGVYEMDGTINRYQMVSGGNILPEELQSYIWDSYDYGNIYIAGQLGTNGIIGTGDDDYNYYDGYFRTMSLKDKTWGVYLLDEFFGSFTNPGNANTWISELGGMAAFGAYYDAGAGYYYDDEGYFFGSTTGGTWQSGRLSADFNGHFLTRTKMGHPDLIAGTGIEGDILGTYNDELGTWEAVSLGSWEGISIDPALDWQSEYLYSYNNYVGTMYGLVGSLQDDTGIQYLAMGLFDLYEDFEGDTPAVWVAKLNEYEDVYTDAFTAGIMENGFMDGFVAGTFFLDSESGFEETAGLIFTDMTGNYHKLDDFYNEGIWESTDTITPVEIIPGLTLEHTIMEDNYTSYFYASDNGSRNITASVAGISKGTSIIFPDSSARVMGMWGSKTDGTYDTATPADGWTLSLDESYDAWYEAGPGSVDGVTLDNSTWSNDDISAYVAGAWVDIEGLTGVIGGKLKGTYDPTDDVSGIWQAAQAGTGMDTITFLELAATPEGRSKLQTLAIPCIEIGRADLTGIGGYNNALTVNMLDTTFFSYSTGAAPRIWTSGDVNGTDSGLYGSMHNSSTVDLAGRSGSAELSAILTVNSFSATPGDPWNASVEFNSGSTVGPTGTEYNVGGSVGGASGVIGIDGSFTGTAAGVVREGAN